MENMNIGLDAKGREQVANLMNRLLSDEFLLYVKTLNYHWNVFGMEFRSLHEFFEEQYRELVDVIDEVAERTRSVGGRPIGSMRYFLDQTRMKEDAKTNRNGREMVQQLLVDHETIIRSLREDIEECDKVGDVSSSDFLTGLMARHEKLAWMHRALIEG